MNITKWISGPDDGIYDAMNKGIDLSRGEYVWFINAGDYIYSKYTLENIFNGDDMDCDIYYGDTLIIDSKSNVLGLRKKKLPKHLDWSHFKNGMVVCHQSIIIRKSIIEKYDTNYKYSADYKWVLNALRKSKSTRNTNEIISVFSEGGATSVHRKKSLKERYHIMKENFGLFQVILSHIRFAFALFGPQYRPYKENWSENTIKTIKKGKSF